jgi:hypothetical protein
VKLIYRFFVCFVVLKGDKNRVYIRGIKGEERKQHKKNMNQCNHSSTLILQHLSTIVEQDLLKKKTEILHLFDSMRKKTNNICIKPYEHKKFTMENVATPTK